MSMASKQKRKQRELRVRRERHQSDARASYPAIIVVNEGQVPPEYLQAIRLAIKSIDMSAIQFGDCDADAHRFLQSVAKHGFQAALLAETTTFTLKEVSGIDWFAYERLTSCLNEKEFSLLAMAICRLQAEVMTRILGTIGQAICMQDPVRFGGWYPEIGFRTCIVGRDVAVVLQRLHRRGDAGHRHWQYMVPLKVKMGPREYELCFSTHALTRIKDRFSILGRSGYWPFVLLYEFLQMFRYRFILVKGVRYLQFYTMAPSWLATPLHKLVKGDGKVKTIDGANPAGAIVCNYMKAFMAPFAIEGDRITLLTALTPGLCPTPESYLLAKPPEHLAEEGAAVRHSFFGEIDFSSPDYTRGLAYFHRAGIPQIFSEPVSITECVVRHYPTPRRLPDFVGNQGDSKWPASKEPANEK